MEREKGGSFQGLAECLASKNTVLCRCETQVVIGMTVDFAFGNSSHGQLLLDQLVNNTGVRHSREKSFTKWP